MSEVEQEVAAVENFKQRLAAIRLSRGDKKDNTLWNTAVDKLGRVEMEIWERFLKLIQEPVENLTAEQTKELKDKLMILKDDVKSIKDALKDIEIINFYAWMNNRLSGPLFYLGCYDDPDGEEVIVKAFNSEREIAAL